MIWLVGFLVFLFVCFWFCIEFIYENGPKNHKVRERAPQNRTALNHALNLGNVGEPLVYYEKILSKKALAKDPYRQGRKARVYSVSCENRAIVVGVSGAGKTNYILSQIIDYMQSGKSYVVTDIKPEIWGVLHTNGLFDYFGYETIIINPTDPYAFPYNMLNDLSKDSDLDEILAILIPAPNFEATAFASYGRLLFKAIILHLFDIHKEGDPPVSLADAYNFFNSYPRVSKMLDKLRDSDNVKIKNLISQASKMTDNERFVSSAISALGDALAFLNDQTILDNQKGDLSLKKELLRSHVAVFLQFEQGQKAITENIYSATVQNVINLLMANHHERDDVFLLFDELLNGGKIENLASKFNLIRSYRMPTFIYIQSLAGLINRYGRGGANEIISACDLKICYRTNDHDTAEYFSREAGEIEVTTINHTSDGKTNSALSRERLLTVDDMNNLEAGKALVSYKGKTAVVSMPIHHKDTLATARATAIRPSDNNLGYQM